MLTEAEKNLTQGKDIHMSPVYIYIPLLSTIFTNLCHMYVIYILCTATDVLVPSHSMEVD